ncbi:MAG: PIN domain-containing protein [Solirubrobacteraceae bacterium]
MIALDAGFLIELERRSPAAQDILDVAVEDELDILVSAMVLAEVWREPPAVLIAGVLLGCRIEPIDAALARAAGTAAGATGAAAPDAIIAAGAARAGAALVTTDPDDMQRLAEHFDGLRIVSI